MSDNKKSRLSSFLEVTALCWVPILLDESKLPRSPVPTAEEQIGPVRPLIDKLRGESLDEVVKHFERVLSEEEKRRSEIESKAFSLFGIAGVAGSFIVGFAQLLFNNNPLPSLMRVLITILYILIGALLLVTILLAGRAIKIGKYGFMSSRPSGLLLLGEWDRNQVYRHYLIDLLQSYEHNQALINDKASWVMGAQESFRNAIVLLLVLLFALTISPFFRVEQITGPTPQISTSTLLAPTLVTTLPPTIVGTPTTVSPPPIHSSPTPSVEPPKLPVPPAPSITPLNNP
ncbi:MAG: hypothetical protein AB1791_14875 [Chloroflexota bacterium]